MKSAGLEWPRGSIAAATNAVAVLLILWFCFGPRQHQESSFVDVLGLLFYSIPLFIGGSIGTLVCSLFRKTRPDFFWVAAFLWLAQAGFWGLVLYMNMRNRS
jgi:hypothetical protein